ncbi:hypothetical protein [Jatrophihabitans sp.]|uniref:hypothetical protein n=1 Tax=Jatrophihabitans sp. TaxID=1932789 RepID=UPI002C7F0FB5|nr:hypothetical protein [Jatrophihabitans sp.]
MTAKPTHLATYVGLLHRSEQTLAESFVTVGQGHQVEADVYHTCQSLAKLSLAHLEKLTPVVARYGEQRHGDDVEEPDRLHADGVAEVRSGAVGLLRDLQDLYLLATLVDTTWTVVYQAAQGARDSELMEISQQCMGETTKQLKWLQTRMKISAPQALLVAS